MIPVRMTITAKAPSSKEETFPIPLAPPTLMISLLFLFNPVKVGQVCIRAAVELKVDTQIQI
jgi:hypothetical protein